MVESMIEGSTQSLHCMIVDADPVFRLGLRVWLAQFPGLTIVAEANSSSSAIAKLAELLQPADQPANWDWHPDHESADPTPPPDVLLLDPVGLDTSMEATISFCQQLQTQYPQLPVLLLTTTKEVTFLAAALTAGVAGYCTKGIEITELVQILRELSQGGRHWDPALEALLQTKPLPTPAPTPMVEPVSTPDYLGRDTVEAQLASLEAQLRLPNLTWLQRTVLQGRRREILAARWCLQQLQPQRPPIRRSAPPMATQTLTITQPGLPPATTTALATVNQPPTDQPTQFRALKALLFESLLTKLPSSLVNQTGEPLEIDILRLEKRQELLFIGIRKLEELLDELRFSQVTPEQLVDKRSQLLVDLWQAMMADFYGKYFTLQVVTPGLRPTPAVEVVGVLLQDRLLVQQGILDKIPLVLDLFNHLLFQAPLVVENVACAPGTPAAVQQAEALLANLLVQLSNGVVQPLLNHFADVEAIKQNFYDRQLMSTREIERFRNALSWKYQLRRVFREPKEIFESQFSLIVFSDRGLRKTSIYAPRTQELETLSGIQLSVTLALEARDAIAPPLRQTVSFVGQGLIYLLTQVIGRGIGLIGRGILQGIGTSWQDLNVSRKSK